MPHIIAYFKKTANLFLILGLFIAFAVSSSTHSVAPDRDTSYAAVVSSAEPEYNLGPATKISDITPRNVGGSYPFMKSYFTQRALKVSAAIAKTMEEPRRKKNERDQELRELVDLANAVPKHTKKFHASAITNSGSRYKSWLNADRTIKRLDSPRAYAVSQIAAKGWKMSQWACLDRLWWHESNWRYQAGDPGGNRAYGIPQAAPGKKMASAGDDWQTNPHTQIDWGLDYIEKRFGTPCKAWDFWAYQAAFGDHGWGWY